jgi:uncharacterized hydrophobic protein (TIGR00341 family)
MALRLIEFILPEDDSGRLDEPLQNLRAIDSWRLSTREGMPVVQVLAEADQVETIIQTLSGQFSHHEGFRIIIMEVTATSPAVELPEKESQEPKEDDEKQKPSPERIACLELVEKLAGEVEISRNYILTIVLSVIVASVGLIRDNVAIIIGAMVIAPLLTPNMALSLATTLGDGKLARRALAANTVGMLIALVLATLVGFVIGVDPSGPEIAGRAAVGYSDIVLALAAGGAGALAFTSGVSAALVGVMVAVAILPPVAAAGLLMGSGYLIMSLKALLLTLANIICVNLSGVGMFLIQGVRPRFFWEAERARCMVKLAAIVWIALLVLLLGVISLSRQFPIQ